MDFSAQGLESYFTRIKYSGPCEPTLAMLRDLQRRHTATFPFENLDVLLGRPIGLDGAAITAKLIHGRRGGFCFEQNGLFWRVLDALGFAVTPLAARVRWSIPDAVETGRTHMLLKVDLADGPYIVDVGFGAVNPTAPFALVRDREQPTDMETFRFVAWGDQYELQVRLAGNWTALYRLSLEAQTLPDFEILNWYVSTAPASRFVKNLTVARPDGDRRLTIFNDRFTIRTLDGRAEERTMAGVDDLIETMRRHFDLDLVGIAGIAGAKAIVERCFPAGRNHVL